MAAPIGNKFWKARSKHGRDKIFATPNDLLMAAYEYFDWNAKNPWYKKELLKSGDRAGELVDVPVERPLSERGLCSFIGVNTLYLNQFEKSCKEKGEEDFSKVIAHIREIIDRQQLEGAKLGVFNHNIVARELGLIERSDLTTGGDKLPMATTPQVINIHPVVVAGAPPIAEDNENDG